MGTRGNEETGKKRDRKKIDLQVSGGLSSFILSFYINIYF